MTINEKEKKEAKHIPVLLKEVIEGLNLKAGDTALDGTVGAGGYFQKICETVGVDGLVIGTDQDQDALQRVEKKLEECDNCSCKKFLINDNFRNLDVILEQLNIKEVQGITFDLGLSSDQFEISGRGFSFKKNEPLLMTFTNDPERTMFTAREIVNNWGEENIADIIYGYGDERYARRIAKKIVEERKIKPIETTDELVEIIKQSVPATYQRGKTHFATKTFQALRVTVNDEICALRDGLEKGFDALSVGGRIAIVSFHSTEDRVVKNFMRDKKKLGEGLIINKKPIVPTREEILANPRSRSSKLRIIEKI